MGDLLAWLVGLVLVIQAFILGWNWLYWRTYGRP